MHLTGVGNKKKSEENGKGALMLSLTPTLESGLPEPLDQQTPWRAKLQGWQCESRWNSHSNVWQMIQNPFQQCTATQVHASYQIPAFEHKPYISKQEKQTKPRILQHFFCVFGIRTYFTFLMKRAISVASVTSKKSRAFAAKSRASCCMVCSISVSPMTALPSSMMIAD